MAEEKAAKDRDGVIGGREDARVNRIINNYKKYENRYKIADIEVNRSLVNNGKT